MPEEDFLSEDWAQSLASLSTPLLNSKLNALQERSTTLSSTLTARLASSPSGQSLLHIGPSLSTLPTDLQSLLSSIEPILKQVAEYTHLNQQELSRIVSAGNSIKKEFRRNVNARECADLLKELTSVENIVHESIKQGDVNGGDIEDKWEADEELNHMASLERVAHTVLYLLHQLNTSSEQVTETLSTKVAKKTDDLPSLDLPLPQDTEMAQFMMNLAPNIRSLEQNLYKALSIHLTRLLERRIKNQQSENSFQKEDGDTSTSNVMGDDLLHLGHLFRSFALIGKGSDAEILFAQVAVMPIIKSNLSIGRLDEGGSRGECTGLPSFMEDVIHRIRDLWGDIIQMVESTFSMPNLKDERIQIDLVTGGVWVPIATALMTDPAIQLAIFSPGIASILQANYVALDKIIGELATTLLESEITSKTNDNTLNSSTSSSVNRDSLLLTSLYYTPEITQKMISSAQQRILRHQISSEFSKKWNLPIYYQLRFGEACVRVEQAISLVSAHGWSYQVFTGTDTSLQAIRSKYKVETAFFAEIIDTLSWLWRSDVFLKPLTHRFIRGAVQIIGCVIAFVNDGLQGEIKFGVQPTVELETNGDGTDHPSESNIVTDEDKTYYWKDRIGDVASIAWDLFALESFLSVDYTSTVQTTVLSYITAISSSEDTRHDQEISKLIEDLLQDTAKEITPKITYSWNEVIVDILTSECSKPLSAVKGVAATYRMTNRPPPTLPSPFVGTILRPLKDFDNNIKERSPSHIDIAWKKHVVDTVSDRYSVAVSELMETVKKTEEALKHRMTRRIGGSGISDGEKVRLQLYLDQQAFCNHISEVGIDPNTCSGVKTLKEMTDSAKNLLEKDSQVE